MYGERTRSTRNFRRTPVFFLIGKRVQPRKDCVCGLADGRSKETPLRWCWISPHSFRRRTRYSQSSGRITNWIQSAVSGIISNRHFSDMLPGKPSRATQGSMIWRTRKLWPSFMSGRQVQVCSIWKSICPP